MQFSAITNVNGTLYFQAYTPTNGYELWKIDPTTGTPSVINIVSGSGSSSPSNLTNVNGILYFQAYTSATGYELWKLNPADDLPVIVSDLYPGGNSCNPSNFINSGGTVYFIANNGTSGSELFRIDPTTGNPVLLDIRTGANSSNPNNLIDANGTLYFIANDSGLEATETVNLTLTNPTGAILGTQNTATLNIVDNDAVPGVIQFSAANFTVNENGTPVTALLHRDLLVVQIALRSLIMIKSH